GGMATVYLAHQGSLDRLVAIKVLPPEWARDEHFVRRFRREAEAVAKLEHPNILPIFDFGHEGDILYMVTPYVAGGTLRERMLQPQPWANLVAILAQIASALDFAHRRGIVHRDVKPTNILMKASDWALLADFGIARQISQAATMTSHLVGTPEYM